MLIKSLNIEITDELIVSDIDDCLIKSTGYIHCIGYTTKQFYTNKSIYNTYKDNVVANANLTKWGHELIEIIKGGLLPVNQILLLTAANNRKESIMNRFYIDNYQIIQGIHDECKIDYLTTLNKSLVYVDNKRLTPPKSKLINMIVYPSNVLINKHVRHGKLYARNRRR